MAEIDGEALKKRNLNEQEGKTDDREVGQSRSKHAGRERWNSSGDERPSDDQQDEHSRDSGQREGTTTAEAQRVKELEREVRELRKANEILKLASAFFAQAELDRRLKS